ncbi:MAG: 4-hydroxybenzoate octaprenyltransferase [Methyloligellaceae bacterium]
MTRVADAPKGNWVDTLAPELAKPYLRLARADRPIGVWLLLWPCWWSLALAGGTGNIALNLWFMLLFAVGATSMRAAGCVYNDILDRNFDAKVERTKSRPIPSGQVSVKSAAIFMVACSLVGFLVLLQFNFYSVILGVASLGVVAIYPLMKRITYWPQFVLGLAFSWGGLLGWTVVKGQLDYPAFLIYLAAVVWTIGYDTIYAHQDKEDDALLGLKSTALRFGKATPVWLSFFYLATSALLLTAGYLTGIGILFYVIFVGATCHLIWQIRTLDINNADNCLERFKSNRDYGAIIFAAIVFGQFY